MADSIIEAKVKRYGKVLRSAFLKMSKRPLDEHDEKLIEIGQQHLRRGLALDKARREKKRKQHERTVDMFDQGKGRE